MQQMSGNVKGTRSINTTHLHERNLTCPKQHPMTHPSAQHAKKPLSHGYLILPFLLPSRSRAQIDDRIHRPSLASSSPVPSFLNAYQKLCHEQPQNAYDMPIKG